MKIILVAHFLAIIGCVSATAGTYSQTLSTQSISLTLATAAKVSVPSTMPVTTVGTTFQNFTGSETVNFKARTTQAGSATLTVLGSAYFGLTTVTYTCSGATLGTACTGTRTVSTSAGTPVVAVGASECVGTGCSSASPATVTMNFSMVNNPTYPTGSYSGTIVYSWTLI